ncbi:MAG: hypothetical protein A3A51_00455 [Candidatus Levybacteria bacterium RIFCSPLOWO2_01_FULL_39_10]|nr:MAG: hypothetical protein A3A51_00455 [Candidatus Levybacteria bacterium RIFCSPLOWO2_01_FULL_39_10]
MEQLFSIKQVAYILKVHPLTIRRYIKEEKLKATKIGGNIRIKESDLANFSKDFIPNKQPASKSPRKMIYAEFNDADPLFQLQGKGASLDLAV